MIHDHEGRVAPLRMITEKTAGLRAVRVWRATAFVVDAAGTRR
jgi:hypothetical protein